MKKLNKKGFTLVEILAVVTVLAIILAIAVPTVTYLIRKQRRNYYESLESSVSLAGRDYFLSNRTKRPTELLDNVGVTVGSLITEDYISEVVDADGGDTCSGNVYVIKNEQKKYDYITCMKCKCSNPDDDDTCEYVSNEDYCSVPGGNNSYEIDDDDSDNNNTNYGDIWLYVGSNYKAPMLNANVKVSRSFNGKTYTVDDKITYAKIYKDGIETELNITEPAFFALKYSYKYYEDDIEIDLFANIPLRNLIVYQYQAPVVTYSNAINNAMVGGEFYNVLASETDVIIDRLVPTGINPAGASAFASAPDVIVNDYLYAYKLKDTEDWSSWQIVDCGSQTGNERDNCTINIESLAGSYEVRFAFNDEEGNVSLDTNNYLRVKVDREPPNCPDLTAVGNYSEATGSRWYRSPVSINFTLPGNISVTKSYINNSAGTDFVAYNQADINESNYIDRKDATIILRKAVGLSAGYILGDYDGNGSISIDDARDALRVAVGLDVLPGDEYLTRADTDGDGIISVSDARKILRCAVGLESCPTVQYSNSLGDVNNDGSITINDARLVLRFEEIIGASNYIEVNNVAKNGNNYTISLNDNNVARTGKFIIKDNSSGLTSTCQLEDYQIDRTTPTVYVAESNGGGNNDSYTSSFAIDLIASTGTNISGQTFQWQKNGIDIAGATSNTITVNETGNYRAIVTTGAGLTATSNTFLFTKSDPPVSCSNIQITQDKSKTIYNASDNNITYTIRNTSANTMNNIYYRVNNTTTNIASLAAGATTTGVVPKPSIDRTQTFEVGYKNEDGENVICKNYTMKYDVTKPTCSVSITGTAGNNGWYKGGSITFKLNFSTENETKVYYGLSTSSTATYNSISSVKLTNSTSGVKYYGFVKDEAGNTNSCNSGAANIKFENSNSVSLTIDQTTWNNLRSTSKKRNNKYVLLFPRAVSSPDPTAPYANTSYGLSNSYQNLYLDSSYNVRSESNIQVINIPNSNHYSRSCQFIYDTDWESSLVATATSGIASTSTNATGKSGNNNCVFKTDAISKYNYNKCTSKECNYTRTLKGKSGQNWPHYLCTGVNAAYRSWTITTNAGNEASVDTYVEFTAYCYDR